MTDCSVETSELSYSFSDQEIVIHGIGLRVPAGSIYGFLGPNGAGKTTTLRLLLGLLRKQRGTISFFGLPFREHRIDILRRVGSLIETPSLYSHLSASENLELLRLIHQCPRSRILEALKLVGLQDTGPKKAGQFSLGMKQRLSIAVAILHEPSLLILDEPTNGLDPNGMIEVRELLKRLNSERGMTILVSSHLLAEIDKLVSHVGVINKGRLVFQGTLDGFKQGRELSRAVILDTGDPARTILILAEHGVHSRLEEGKVIMTPLANDQIALVNRWLVTAGIDVYGISAVRGDLESVFMELINT